MIFWLSDELFLLYFSLNMLDPVVFVLYVKTPVFVFSVGLLPLSTFPFYDLPTTFLLIFFSLHMKNIETI